MQVQGKCDNEVNTQNTFRRRGYLHILWIGVTKYPSRGTSVCFRPPSSMQFWGRYKNNYMFKT